MNQKTIVGATPAAAARSMFDLQARPPPGGGGGGGRGGRVPEKRFFERFGDLPQYSFECRKARDGERNFEYSFNNN